MIEADNGHTSGLQDTSCFLDGLQRVGCVVENSEGVHDVEGGVGKRERLGVRARQPCLELLVGKTLTGQLQMGLGEIDRIRLRARARELRMVRTEPGTDLEQAAAPKGLEAEGFLHPGGVDLVAMFFDAPEERRAATLEVRRHVCPAGVGVPLPLGLELGVNVGHCRSLSRQRRQRGGTRG